ncbi:S8 family serine peptidase [Dactylosporangium sp. NPDC049525]|uniref:S8 family serine peptidase n=1 Tax=Dactylosporangium sp. NPDC049525 TaxID=3154730 RepID=UPI003429A555
MTEPDQPRLIRHAGRTMDPRTATPARAAASVAGRSPGAGVRSVVQFRRALTRDERARVQREHGLALTDYLPDGAYVESVPADRVADLERDPLVQAVLAFGADLRRPATGGRRSLVRRQRPRYEVALFADADGPTVLAELAGLGAQEPVVLDDRPHGGTVKIRFGLPEPVEPALDGIAGLDDVRWLDEVGEAKLDSSEVAPPVVAAVARDWAAPLWRLGLTGAGQVIGVMDSPVDLGHRFFADPQQQVGPSHRKVTGYRNAVAEPPARHGTFVAGIAAGDDPGRPGGHPDRGVAWAARLTYGNADDIERAGVLAYLAAAAADGAHVHTNSWHDEPEIQYDQLAADLDTFTWNHEEHLVLGSAGNRGERMGPPGTAKNVLSVAASLGPAPAGFGDGATGPAADGRHKPEVMAPGCSIRSAVVGTAAGVDLDRHVFGSLTAICASSWATPAVAALAALVRQYYVDGHHPGGPLVPSAALLRATVIAGCLPDSPGSYPSDTGGWGAVRVDETLRGPLLVRDVRHAGGLDTGESATLEVDVAGPARPLSVTLVWTDPPGLAGSDAPAVNALDLTVEPPHGGPPLHGNVFAGGFSTPGEASGRRDTVQRVLVREPVPGRWTVRVTATAVHVGNPGQGYALTVAGDIAQLF